MQDRSPLDGVAFTVDTGWIVGHPSTTLLADRGPDSVRMRRDPGTIRFLIE